VERETKHTTLHVHPEDPTRRAGVPRHKRVDLGTLLAIKRDSKKPRRDFEGA